MSKRRSMSRRRGSPGTSKAGRKQLLGKMSLGCLVLLVLIAAWLIVPGLIEGR